MKPFKNFTALAVPFILDNIDTDAIIPSREIKSISKVGLGQALFAGWRYTEPGGRAPKPTFVLNLPEYKQAKILITGENFGCGSSREHAVWALQEWGFRTIIAPSFGTIFYSNCIQNGILPVVLERKKVAELAFLSDVSVRPRNKISIILDEQLVASDGKKYEFQISPAHKEMLLTGQDQIDLTLKMGGKIKAFQAQDRKRRPWAYL